jgi:membrane protease YdiL (CAAX protease family)
MEQSIFRDHSLNPDFITHPRQLSETTDTWRRVGFAGLAFFVWAASVAMIALVPAIFLMPYLASAGIPLSDVGQIADFAKNDQTAVLLQIIAILPAHLLTLFLAYIVVSQGRKFEFFKTLGWESGGVRWWHYCTILGAFFVIAGIVSLFVPEQDNELLRLLRSSRYAVYIVAFVATVSAPLIEEVIYRGVLYSAFQRAFGIPLAFLLVTLLFALVHVPQYYPSYSTILLLTLLSVTLTGLRVWSNNLWPCVVLHTIFNGLQSTLLIAEPWIGGGLPPNP